MVNQTPNRYASANQMVTKICKPMYRSIEVQYSHLWKTIKKRYVKHEENCIYLHKRGVIQTFVRRLTVNSKVWKLSELWTAINRII